ncbi:hypothetical protein [Hansschlegelia sp. KR7-227]|uniref:hypothetical protein n=1 Tax=Hansschlegelia sp. KR7-227 TaxID=3400914 RepID=UPI003C0740B7
MNTLTHFNADAVRAQIAEAGYSDAAISKGIAYAADQGASDDHEAFVLAVSRILYSDEDLAEGARFAA